MASKRSEFLIRIALVLVGIVLSLGLVELALRLLPDVLSEETQIRMHWTQMVFTDTTSERHPYVGFTYPPHHEGELERADFRFRYRTDGHGFRNPWPWPPKAEIVAVGDSNTFGYGVEDDQAWTALVANNLPCGSIINLGLIGASPQQYLRVYETFGVSLAPELVLFGLHPASDLGDSGVFQKWLKADGPGNYDIWRFFQGQAPDRQQSLLEQLHLYWLARETLIKLRNPRRLRGRTLEFADGGRLNLVMGPEGKAVFEPQPDDLRLSLRAIEQAHDLAVDNGAQFLVLIFPTKEEVYLPVLGEPSSDLATPFIAELKQRDIAYLDLAPAMREYAKENEQLFFRVDGHANARGNEIIARTFLDYLGDRDCEP